MAAQGRCPVSTGQRPRKKSLPEFLGSLAAITAQTHFLLFVAQKIQGSYGIYNAKSILGFLSES